METKEEEQEEKFYHNPLFKLFIISIFVTMLIITSYIIGAKMVCDRGEGVLIKHSMFDYACIKTISVGTCEHRGMTYIVNNSLEENYKEYMSKVKTYVELANNISDIK